jgi:cytosine/adenosine deaminase-related metal-dependent hydrolase
MIRRREGSMTVRALHTLLLGILGLGGLFRAPAASAQEPLSPGKDAPASLVNVPSDVPADARRYAVLIAGNRAGVLAAWVSPDGVHHTFFAFNDRGRGPSITTRVVLDATGVITELDATGNDYLKAPVNERFRLAGGKASWSSDAEKGEKRLTAPALYAPMSGTLTDETEAALLAAPGHRLPLLPEGEASIDRVAEQTIDFGGRPVKAILYEETGFGFTPGAVWLDEDGRLVATGSDWGAFLREGAEASWPTLLKAQKARESARGEELARKLEKNLVAPLLVRHARLFDSEAASVRDGMSVRVVRGRIAAVGPDSSVTASAGDEVLDARGRMLLPGLWDMHVHVGDWDDGLLHIAAGVTTVRDMANDIDHLQDLASRFDSGALIGPHVLKAGFIDGRGPYQGPTKVFADTPEEARADVDRYAALGYVQIKIYSSVKPELVPVIAAEAHRRGMRVSGHIPAFMTMEQAVAQGYDEVQHANFWFLNFQFDAVPDTRTPARFTAVAEHGAELDLSSERVRAFVRLLQDHHTVLDPTVNVFEEMFLARPGVMSPPLAEVASRLPPQVRRSSLSAGLPVPEGMDQRYRDSYAAILRMLKVFYDAGVPIVAGTDALAGFSLHSELEQYVAAGIPAPKALQIATLGAARVMKRDGETGSIAPGKASDFVLVDGDPVAKISDIRRVVTVIRGDRLYDAGALYAALGVRPISPAARER